MTETDSFKRVMQECMAAAVRQLSIDMDMVIFGKRIEISPFMRFSPDWNMLIAPRFTRLQRWWRDFPGRVKDGWDVFKHGYPETDDW